MKSQSVGKGEKYLRGLQPYIGIPDLQTQPETEERFEAALDDELFGAVCGIQNALVGIAGLDVNPNRSGYFIAKILLIYINFDYRII